MNHIRFFFTSLVTICAVVTLSYVLATAAYAEAHLGDFEIAEPSTLPASCADVTVTYLSYSTNRIKTGTKGFLTQTNPVPKMYRQYRQENEETVNVSQAPNYSGSFSLKTTNTGVWPTDNYQISYPVPESEPCAYTLANWSSVDGHAQLNGYCGGISYDCSSHITGGVWDDSDCYTDKLDWAYCLNTYHVWDNSVSGSGTETTNDTLQISYSYYSNDVSNVGRTLTKTTLSDEYTTSELISRLIDDVRDAPFPGSDQKACLSLESNQRCGNATKIKVIFKFQSAKDVIYKLSWLQVTTNDETGTSTGSIKKMPVKGTGGIVEVEFVILPPMHRGCIFVSGVSLAVDPYKYRWPPPGSGGPQLSGAGPRAHGGCTSCGSGAHILSSANFEMEMGPRAFGGSVGALTMHAGESHDGLGKPSMLEFLTDDPQVVVVKSANNIRQVKALQALADVETVNAFKFNVKYFLPSQVGSPDGNGIYALSGSPYVTWTVENPDTTNAFNKWRITETRDGTSRTNLYVYTSGTRTWKLTSPGNLREDELKIENDTNTNVRIETTWVRKPGGSDLEKVKRIYKKFDWGEAMVAKHVGSDSDPHITTNIFSTSGAANGTRLPLEKTIYPTGAWQKYEYDAYGRLAKTVSQFLNFSEGAGENYHRVTTLSYDVVGGSSGDQSTIQTNTARTTIHKLRGQEIGRSYKIFRTGGEELDIVCPTPGAAWNASDNLVTVTKHYTTGDNSNRVSSIKRPDGTMSFFDYSETATNRTTIETSGQPDELELAILNGTETITVINSVGEMASRTVRAVINGSANIVLSSEVGSDYDEYSRPRKMTYIGGSFTWTDHGACCGTTSETNREGALIEYFRDDLQRVVATKTLGITTSNILDAAGRTVAVVRKGTDNSLITLKSARYDLAGRVTFETNALGGVTAFTEGFVSGQPVKTNTYPDGGVRIETYFIDGQLEKVTGSAAHPVRYTHGIESDSVWRAYTTEYKLDTNGTDTAEWIKTLSDGAGRSYKTLFAGDGTPYEQSFYNNAGQLWKQRDPDGVITLNGYNSRGELAYTALDSNRNDTIDFSGLDRITQTTNDVSTRSGVDVERTSIYVWETGGSSTATLLSTVEVATNGLSTWRTGPSGTSSTVISAPPWGTKTITETAVDGSYSISLYHTGRLVSVTGYDSAAAQIGKTSYGYDAHGRQNTIADARNGTTTLSFNNADQIVTTTTPAPGNGQPAQTVTTYYSKMLQATNIVQPDGTSVTNEYFQTGLQKKVSGSRQYTIAYTYDAQGRLKTMTTWTNAASGNSADTTWTYNERGLLTNKAYADGLGPNYTYTAGGRLATRTWARGSPRISTTYAYNHAGDLATVDYSDATLDLTYGYDRRGRATSIVQGSSVYATTLGYNLAGQIVSESFNGQAVTNGYDSLLRRTAVGLSGQAATLVKYGYDAASRLTTVTNDVNVTSYSYIANSPLLDQITFKNNGTTRMTTTKSWDKLDRLLSINSVAGAAVGSAYTYNSANQRSRNTQTDGSYWVYEYDKLGQVISGKKYWSDGTPVEGQQFEYAFDDIGNRRSAKSAGNSSGADLRTATYSANSLNQYTSRSVPGYIDVTGVADARSTVTVNSQSTYRKGEYFRKELTISNGSTNVYQAITNAATFGSTNETVTGNIFVPQTPEAFYYDVDGNLTNDGRWFYVWDAENRLTEMIATNVVGGARRKLTFEYDYQGRRARKTSYHPDGANWSVINDHRFVYDGWNLLAELNATNNAVIRSFSWGTDVSDSLQGAGGIGGLISVLVHSGPNSGTYFYTYDGNGNVLALVSSANGAILASYEYSPFGGLIRATGPLAHINPFRFSTKFHDEETDLLYYGYRYYCVSTGRWLTRDPIEEGGGFNLYDFTAGNPVNEVDYLGMCAPSCDVQSFQITSKKWIGAWPSRFPRRLYSKQLKVEFKLVLKPGADKSKCRIRQEKRGRVKTARVAASVFPTWTDDGGDWWTGSSWRTRNADWSGLTATFEDRPGLADMQLIDFPIYWGSVVGPGFFDFNTYVIDVTRIANQRVAELSWGLYFEYVHPGLGKSLFY